MVVRRKNVGKVISKCPVSYTHLDVYKRQVKYYLDKMDKIDDENAK